MSYTDFETLLRLLRTGDVEFILVGGVAGNALGAARVTTDLDVLYSRSPENLDKLAIAVAPLQPYPRGAPPGLPFKWDRKSLDFGLNFTLQTIYGALDLLGEIAGGTYASLIDRTVRLDMLGVTCRCLNISALIDTKRAAGRPKDFEALAELEIIRDLGP